jgi:hypothetical protein
VLAAEAIHAILALLSAHLCRNRWVWAFKVDNSTAAKGDAQVQETWRPIDGTLETNNALVRERNFLAASRYIVYMHWISGQLSQDWNVCSRLEPHFEVRPRDARKRLSPRHNALEKICLRFSAYHAKQDTTVRINWKRERLLACRQR